MYYTVSILFKRVVNFLLNISIARAVSIQDFGEYSQFIIFATYLLLITEFGYNEYILVKSKKQNNLSFLITNFTVISLLTFVIVSVLALFYSLSVLFFLVLLKVYMDTYLSKLLLTYYQFEQKFHIVSTINIIYSVSIAFLILFLHFSSLNIINLLLSLNIIIFISIIMLLYKSSIHFKVINLKSLLPHFNKDFFYYAFASITIPIYMQMPLFVMTFYLSKEEIAIFYLAYTLSSVMLLISVSINQQYLPKIIHDSTNSFYKLIKVPVIFLILFSVMTFLLFYFFGNEIIISLLNKPEYIESNDFIIWLVISNGLQSISGLLTLFIVSKGLMKEKLKIHIELIVISIVLSFVMIQMFSSYGVVYTYILLYTYTIVRYFKKISEVIKR